MLVNFVPHVKAKTDALASKANEFVCPPKCEYHVHNELECSMFVLDGEVALLDLLLGGEINALFYH